MLPSEELLFFFIWTISNIFTLVVSVILSVVLFQKYSNYLKRRRNVDNCKLISRTLQTQSSKNAVLINYAILKENYERKMGSNMFYMISTLCLITIFSRLLKTCCFVYFYFFPSFDISLRVLTANIITYTLVPTISILVFSSFNKIFRNELKNIVSYRSYACLISK